MRKKIDFSNKETIAIIILCITSVLVLLTYDYLKNIKISILMAVTGLIFAIITYGYKNKSQVEDIKEQEIMLKELFKMIAVKQQLSKEELLELNIPLEMRSLIERSLAIKLNVTDYQKCLNAHLSIDYQKMIMGIYFLLEENSKMEFDEMYKQFLQNEKNIDEDNKNNELKKLYSLPIYLIISFICLLLIFIIPTLKEIFNG